MNNMDVFRQIHVGILAPQLWDGLMHHDLGDPGMSTMKHVYRPVMQPYLLPKLIPLQVDIMPWEICNCLLIIIMKFAKKKNVGDQKGVQYLFKKGQQQEWENTTYNILFGSSHSNIIPSRQVMRELCEQNNTD